MARRTRSFTLFALLLALSGLIACSRATPSVVTSASPAAPTSTLVPTRLPPTVTPTATAVPPTTFPTPRTDCKERYSTVPAERDYWPTTEWRVSSLAEHCLDPEKVEHAAWYLEKGITARSL